MTIASKFSVKVDGEAVPVDPHLLLQRLTLAGKSNLEEALSTYPPTLFESQDLLNGPQKASFADAVWSNISKKDPLIPKQVKYILDGGALLHQIPLVIGSTFGNIIDQYTVVLMDILELQPRI